MNKILEGDVVAYVPKNLNKNVFAHLISFLSRFVAGNFKLKGDSYSHVSIAYTLPYHVIESTFPKATIGLLEKDGFDIYIISPNLTQKQRCEIIKKAHSLLNTWYDLVQLISLGLFNIRKAHVCSEFVAQCYLYAGINLYKEKEYLVSPNELVDRLLNLGAIIKKYEVSDENY